MTCKEDDDSYAKVLTAFFVASFIFAIGCIVGSYCQGKEIKTEAIKAGAAEWVADKDGNPLFRWKNGNN